MHKLIAHRMLYTLLWKNYPRWHLLNQSQQWKDQNNE